MRGTGRVGRYNGRLSSRTGVDLEIIAIIVLLIAAWLAVKVVGFLFKAGMVLLAFAILYWLVAPHLGLPQPWL